MKKIITVTSALLLIGLSTGLTTGCTHSPHQAKLNLQQGWYEDQAVYYVTTDVSDAEMAKAMDANYTPRLLDAIPDYPRPPEVKTILERVYFFPNKEQGNVLASIPTPLGPSSEDLNYSPIWLLFKVTWLGSHAIQPLRSEEAILSAQEKGWIDVEHTNIVVNCPVVSIDNKQFLQQR